MFRVRPVNQPRRRIMGAAVLLDRFLVAGLPVGLGEVVEDLSPAKLTGSLCAAGVGGPAYVGRSRARDLAVNAVLPFMHAWGEVSRQGGRGRRLPQPCTAGFRCSPATRLPGR